MELTHSCCWMNINLGSNLIFLQYINQDESKWAVCIGVPYGTAYWQVEDSSKQNGTFKMRLTQEKKKLFKKKVVGCQGDLQLLRTDIIPLVNSCFHEAFSNVQNNQKAIREQGWFPYNCNLLLDPTIC